MSQPAEIGKLLAPLARVLRDVDVEWYLFGAQAVMVWGRPRMSADVDVTARLSPKDSADLIQRLQTEGFDSRVEDPQAFALRTRVIPLLHRSSGLPLDLVLAGPGIEEEFLERAVTTELQGVVVPVISPEDLVITKILAGRPKDLEDVYGVVQEQLATLDRGRVRSMLSALEQALARADLLSEFDEALRRAGETS